MTSSRSKASRSSWIAAIAAVLLVMLGLAGRAEAQRKRVVVLDFDGDKAEKFHADLVKLIKKSHTVVSVDKWNEKAEEMSAKKANEGNIKKVAKKLKIDGVITGSVEKRRDEYIVRMKLRAGVSGVVVNQTQVKADGPKLDKAAQSEIKDELIEAIASLKANRGGGDEEEEEEETPKKSKFGKKKKAVEEEEEAEEEEKPKKLSKKEEAAAKKKAAEEKRRAEEEEKEKEKAAKAAAKKKKAEEEEEEKAAKVAAAKKKTKKAAAAEEEEEEENPLPKTKPKKRPAKASEEEEEEKTVASSEETEEVEETFEPGTKMATALAVSPGQRAVDVVVGVSLNRRTMSFVHEAALVDDQRPKGYTMGIPVAGAILDLTVYPLAMAHKRTDMLKNVGVTAMYDKVLLINSKDAMGNTLDTSHARFALGGVFRYPFNKTATSPVLGASLRVGRQNFTISGNTGIPNVNYTIVDPQLFVRYPISPKLILNANLGYMAILNTGQMTKADAYGPASVNGFEGELGADYMLTKNIFARAAFRFETIGYTFNGTGMLRNRDNDPEPDVFGARDTYLGGLITAGYLY